MTTAGNNWAYGWMDNTEGKRKLYIRFDGDVVQKNVRIVLPKPNDEPMVEYLSKLTGLVSDAGLEEATMELETQLGWMYGSPYAESELYAEGWVNLGEEELARYSA